MHEIKNITITPEILKLIADIDEFKGRWTVIETLAPERLTSLRRIATIESVGSAGRIAPEKAGRSFSVVWKAIGSRSSTISSTTISTPTAWTRVSCASMDVTSASSGPTASHII